MKPIITRFDKNNGDIKLTIPMFDKDIFHRIQQIERCDPSWFDTEHYNIFDLIKENQELKKQLEYIRSGEYFNQLRFERNMLQNLVFYGEVSKEDKEFIDMTHRNTELLEEIQSLKKENKILRENAEHNDKVVDKINWKNELLKKQLEDTNEELELVRCDLHNRTSERDGYYRNIEMLENHQKEFIDWLENGINQVRNTEFLDERIQRAGLVAYNRVLSKYKEIIGVSK